MAKSNPLRDLEDSWRITEDGEEITFPIFYFDPSIPDFPVIKLSIKDLLSDFDFWRDERNKEDRIIDSTGKVFTAEYKKEMVKGTFFPTEFRSGVFPGKLERIMEITEAREIMISGVEGNKARINVDIEELKSKINSLESIHCILEICNKKF